MRRVASYTKGQRDLRGFAAGAALADGLETYMAPGAAATPRDPRSGARRRRRSPSCADGARAFFSVSHIVFRARRGLFARALLGLTVVAFLACAPAAAEPLGDTPASARSNTNDLFGALALRLGPLTRSARLKLIRPRYVRGSLIPSRIYDDTTIWTAMSGTARTLVVAGHPAGGGYLLDVDADARSPQHVAESRHIMRLRALGDDAWEWRSTDELAVGAASPTGIDAMRRRLLASAEGRTGPELRLLWQRGLPRTTAALGRLFAVDSVTTATLADRSTAVTFRISLDSARLRGALPDFARWVDKYASRSRLRIVIEDHDAVPFAILSSANGLIRVRLRTRDGILQPLAGAARIAPPDSLRMRAEVSTKAMLFTVGARDILADVVPVRTATERGWFIRYRHEPEWRLPLAVDHLMRDALRRPFAGEGTWTRLVARGEPGGYTLIVRDFHMEVQESALVRWLSAFGNSAMGDVTSRVEQQKDRFIADAIAAFGDDLAAQIGGTDGRAGLAR